ncbi:MAG: hypothetical protein V1645_04785 [archaeon]
MEAQPLTQLLEANRRNITYYEEDARSKIEKLLSQPLLPAEQNKVYETLKKFVALDFVYQLSRKYPIISEGIFNLKKEEEIKTKKNESDSYPETYMLEIPIVVKIPLQSEKVGDVFKTRVQGYKKGDSHKYKQEVDITCPIPELTPEARVAFAEAVQLSAELTARGYKDNLISRILVMDRMNGRSLDGPLTSNYSLVWAPSQWNAKIVERDPAILMRYAGTNMMIHHWTIPEETSLDALLRDFTENLFEEN